MSLVNFISILGASNASDTYWIGYHGFTQPTSSNWYTRVGYGVMGASVDADDNIYISGNNTQSSSWYARIFKIDTNGAAIQSSGGWSYIYTTSNPNGLGQIGRIDYLDESSRGVAGYTATAGSSWGAYASQYPARIRGFTSTNLNDSAGISITTGDENYDATIGYYANNGVTCGAVMIPGGGVSDYAAIISSQSTYYLKYTNENSAWGNPIETHDGSLAGGLAVSPDGTKLYVQGYTYSYWTGVSGQFRYGQIVECIRTDVTSFSNAHIGRLAYWPSSNASNYSYTFAGFRPAVDPNGYVYSCFLSDNNPSASGAKIIVTKAADGIVADSNTWTKNIVFNGNKGASAIAFQYGSDCAVDSKGNLYIAHHDGDGINPSQQLALTKLNTDGDLEWSILCTPGNSYTPTGSTGGNAQYWGSALVCNSKDTPIWSLNGAVVKLPPDGSLSGSYTVGGQTYTFADNTSNITVNSSSGSGFSSTQDINSTTPGLNNFPKLYTQENNKNGQWKNDSFTNPTLDTEVV